MNVRLRSAVAVAAALVLAGSMTACDLLDAVEEATSSDTGDADAPTNLAGSLEQLTIAEESREGYDRNKFSGWITESGCDTRQLVLIEEDVTQQSDESDCRGKISGEWLSVYDGEVVTDPSKLDIDHMVPLAEAWDSGASNWDDARRAEYATFLDDPRHLIAVTASSNRSKGDKDPAEWLPPDESAICQYLVDWVTIKLDWDLTIDQAEHDAIVEASSKC